MAGPRAYLDYNASAPLLPAARAAVVAALEVEANPSSVHSEGRAARKIIEDARRDVAALVGARPEHVVFTSGATEAATTLLSPDWRMGRGAVRMSRLHVTEADHPCVLNGGRFPRGDGTPVSASTRTGIVDLDCPGRRTSHAHDKARKACRWSPIHARQQRDRRRAARHAPRRNSCRSPRRPAGRSTPSRRRAACRSISSERSTPTILIHLLAQARRPQGRRRARRPRGELMMPAPLVPRRRAGKGPSRRHREPGRRLAGFAAAARAARGRAGRAQCPRSPAMRDRARRAGSCGLVSTKRTSSFGQAADGERVANTTFFSSAGPQGGRPAQIAFDLAGVALSAGSACSSGKVGPSHVLTAMGFADNLGALRVSIGRQTSEADVEKFETALAALLSRRTDRTKAA
jgi:cysteine desulfurase